MENYDVIGLVNTLLHSDIQTSQISKETGISKGYITNLRKHKYLKTFNNSYQV